MAVKKKYTDWSEFDIIAFLDDNYIDYQTAGKNIGQGHIGLENCPFCDAGGCHFGIRMSSNVGSCWVCGESGAAPKIVQAITNLAWGEVFKILRLNLNEDRWIPESPTPGDDVIFPSGITKVNRSAEEYLWSRDFDYEFIARKYKVKCTESNSYLEIEGHKWNFSRRVIIPIIMENMTVAYTGRSYIGKDPKYFNSPTEACIIPPASCIYNIDTVKEIGILVEGLTDVWRMGDESASMQGVKYTDEQIHYIGKKNLKKAFVLFDPGADEAAKKLCKALGSVVPEVHKITLNGDADPGELTAPEAMHLKYELLGRI